MISRISSAEKHQTTKRYLSYKTRDAVFIEGVPFNLSDTQLEDLLKYLILAIVVGGAVPIILSYLTKKPPKK